MEKWVSFENGQTIGHLGTEDGVILKDEEMPGIGRITLEGKRTEASITCGLYGTFFDTVSSSLEDGSQKYDEMKLALENSPDGLEELEVWCDWFVNKF